MRGFDESSYQHPGGRAIDWKAVYAAGYRAVYIKATELSPRPGGTSAYVNPYLAGDIALAREAGLKVGAYWMLHPAVPVADQVALFTTHAPLLDLPPRVDVEIPDGLDWLRVANAAHLALRLTAAARAEAGIYYNESWRAALARYGAPWGFPEWVAAPGMANPHSEDVQTGEAPIPGVAGGAVDQDTIDQLGLDGPASGGGGRQGEGTAPAAGTSQRGILVMLKNPDTNLAIAVIAHPGGGEWIVFQDGGVHTANGAPYFGSYTGTPDLWKHLGDGSLAPDVFTDASARYDASGAVIGYALLRQDGALYRYGADLFEAYQAGGGR